MPVRKVPLTLLGLFTLAALLPVSVPAATTDAVVVPTTATIFEGKLIDRIPGPPSNRLGPTPRPNGVSVPFYGRVSSEHPACAVRRTYEFGSYVGSHRSFISNEELSFGSPGPVPEGGKWHTELESTWSDPIHFAIRVLPKETVYKGVSYHCEEAVSPEVVVGRSDFSPCKLALAAKRGYVPAVRLMKRLLHQAEAHNWPVAHRYREELKKYRNYWPAIKQAATQRC
jgi:hypothetical protein